MASQTHSVDSESEAGHGVASPGAGGMVELGAGHGPFYVGFFLLGVLALLGMSPWLAPDFYDNVTYFETAKSLIAGDGYRLNGEIIADWPPLHPVLLAAVFALGGASVVLAKLVSLGAALIGLYLACQLMVKEKREWGLLAVGLLAVFPTSLILTTRISSDWTFAALSFGFLLGVEAMRTRRSTRFAILVGVLLGLASLTRYPGVLLGVALVASGVATAWRARSVKAAVSEVIAALVGFLIWAAWMGYLLVQQNSGQVAEGNYEASGTSLFSHFGPFDLATQWSDLLFQWANLAERLGLGATAAGGLAMVPVLLMAVGFGARVRRREMAPSDWYVIATLCLLVMYYWKMGRYLIPLAPFLMCYLFDGVRMVGARLLPGNFGHWGRTAIALWAGVLLALNLNLLFRAGGEGHGPVSPLASPSAAHFYRGEWADLFFAGEFVKDEGGGVVAIDEALQKYALPWFGVRETVGLDAEEWDFRVLSTEVIPPVGNVVFSNAGYRVYAKEGAE